MINHSLKFNNYSRISARTMCPLAKLPENIGQKNMRLHHVVYCLMGLLVNSIAFQQLQFTFRCKLFSEMLFSYHGQLQ